MKKVLIALKLADQLPAEKADLIGCDKGALTLAQQHRHMVCAVGDFDSVREEDISLIAQWCDQIIRLNPIKDDSDSEHAVKTAIDFLLIILISLILSYSRSKPFLFRSCHAFLHS